ncbi:MAG: HAD family hydrolase [Acidobacteria bacterium]|nr:MAG: HAD family hydrolase [Acidobacteriota bacterium]
MKKAIFLDRDGTLIEEIGFLHRIEDLKLFSFTDEALSILKKAGFLLIVITNQSGIGRGFFSEAEMHQIHVQIQKELNNKIDAFYFCPHLPQENCNCRKPKTGMIEKAVADFNVNKTESWIVGDKQSDIELGFNACTKTAMVLTGYGVSELPKLKWQPDLIGENLLEIARKITSVYQ